MLHQVLVGMMNDTM